MKKVLAVSFVLVALVLCSAVPASADADTNRAKAAALADPTFSQCVNDARQDGFDVDVYAEVSGICFVEGSTYRVQAVAGPKCEGNKICPMYIMLAATAEVDCEFNVTSTECARATE